jgi:2-polyprenyl-3-methyl-5-hydroxy-6-metoxy-1,4-benzoquinol methylase
MESEKSQKGEWTKAFLNPSTRRWLFGFKETKIVELMLCYLDTEKFKKILDVGCGSGRNSLALAKIGFEVYGMDFVESAITSLSSEAKKEGFKIKAIVHDLTTKWPFTNGFFDAAFINVVLDSINQEGRFFIARELARTLKSKGLLFIYEPSINDEYYKQFLKNNSLRFVCPDDNIEREIFTKETICEPFENLFDIKIIREIRNLGKMFGKVYKRAWWFLVLENKKT